MRRPRIGVIFLAVAAVVGITVLVLGVWAYPRMRGAGARSETSVLDEVRNAALQWQSEHPKQCPTVEQLITDGSLDSGLVASGKCRKPYRIHCVDKDVDVTCPDPAGTR
jgi:hypothetical protein